MRGTKVKRLPLLWRTLPVLAATVLALWNLVYCAGRNRGRARYRGSGTRSFLKVDSKDRRIAAALELPGTGDANVITRQLGYDAPAKSFKMSSKFVEMPLSHRAPSQGKSHDNERGAAGEFWDRINSYVVQDDLDEIVERSKRLPDEPFADAGAAIERISQRGHGRRDVRLLLRYAAYRGVFDTLYVIDPEGAEVDCKDLIDLHEWLCRPIQAGWRGVRGQQTPSQPSIGRASSAATRCAATHRGPGPPSRPEHGPPAHAQHLGGVIRAQAILCHGRGPWPTRRVTA